VVRVAVYIDGFNLYFGLRAKSDRKYLWLDLQALSVSLLRRPTSTSPSHCWPMRCGTASTPRC
jgi:hypothetical protein